MSIRFVAMESADVEALREGSPDANGAAPELTWRRRTDCRAATASR